MDRVTIDKMRKRYNKLMCEIGMDHKVSDSAGFDEMISEVEYWLDMMYCDDTSLYDLKYDEPKLWRSWVGKLRRFINRFGDAELE